MDPVLYFSIVGLYAAVAGAAIYGFYRAVKAARSWWRS